MEMDLITDWAPKLPSPPLSVGDFEQGLVDEVKPQLAQKLGIEYQICQALYFRSQSSEILVEGGPTFRNFQILVS